MKFNDPIKNPFFKKLLKFYMKSKNNLIVIYGILKLYTVYVDYKIEHCRNNLYALPIYFRQ